MNVSDTLESLRSFDINDLDLNEAGIWPTPVKVILCVFLIGVVVFAGYHFHVKELKLQLAEVAEQEESLRSTFEKKAARAANLDAYRAQIKEMDETFGALLKQLPADTEVPGLLEDITDTGLGSGLDFRSIQLKAEVAREFYVELPIALDVSGGYHEMASFVSGVAGLPRIVTLHDFSIRPAGNNPNALSMSILAKTYRYKSE